MLIRWWTVTLSGSATALLACVYLLLLGPTARAQSERYEGQKITAVYLEPKDQPLTRDQIGLSLGIRPGDILDEVKLSDAIVRLYDTGRYTDIQVEAEPENGGIALTFKTVPAHFVSLVVVKGIPDPPNPARQTSATDLELGAEFKEDTDIPRAIAGLRELLVSNGFHTPTITYSVERTGRTQEANIIFTVDPGVRSKFTKPTFSGDLQRTEKALIKTSNWLKWWGLRGWKDFTERQLQSGLEKIRSNYLKQNRLLASVRLLDLQFDPRENVVSPSLRIDAGPRVLITTEGAKVGRGTLQNLIPVFQERTIDRELLFEGKDNLLDHFQSKGYFDVTVDFRTESDDAGRQEKITYVIGQGERYKLVDLEVNGNEYFHTETIKERLAITPARFPQYRRGRFSNDLLERDKDALIDLYRSNGFRDVQVNATVVDNFGGKPHDIGVKLEIQEGQQWTVASLDLSGVDLKLLGEIEALITSTPGQPFSVASVATDRDSILNWYFNNGYPETTMEAIMTPIEHERKMSLRYAVSEGRRNFVREVLVNGLVETRLDLVTSRLAVRPGDPLSQSSIVETQRRLYDLGIFAKVDVAVQNPQGRERNKYVLMQIEEAKKYSLNLGFGAAMGRIGSAGGSLDAPAGATGFSPRMLVSLSRLNFMGLGHTASAYFRLSNFQRRALLTYLAPQFRGNEDVNLTFSGLYDRSSDVRTFTSTRYESAVQIGQRLSRANSIQYRVNYRDVSIDEETLNIDPGLIPIYSQPVKVTVLSGTFIQDRRDDPLDSTRGMYNTVDGGYAPGVLSGHTAYTRLSLRNSTYHKISRSFLLARTATFGWMHNQANEPIPLPELFYAGGANTHRGFPENQAGPRDSITGFPVGGAAFLIFGTELRFPLIGTNLGGVLFHDMGNVYSGIEKVSFRYRQRDRSDFDYAVQAFGFGLRVKTPVGPIRLDLAYAPNSTRFVGFEGTRDDLINGTGKYNVPQRVNPFQFHFSIGQSF